MKTSKINKVLTIIILCLLATLGIAILVIYIIQPKLIQEWFAYIVDFINKPLPIVGVTTLAILVFVWKLVITLNYGKAKLIAYDNKVKEILKAKEDFENCANEKMEELKAQNQELKGFIEHICELSTNQKIKNYGKELLSYGEETINSETKAD